MGDISRLEYCLENFRQWETNTNKFGRGQQACSSTLLWSGKEGNNTKIELFNSNKIGFTVDPEKIDVPYAEFMAWQTGSVIPKKESTKEESGRESKYSNKKGWSRSSRLSDDRIFATNHAKWEHNPEGNDGQKTGNYHDEGSAVIFAKNVWRKYFKEGRNRLNEAMVIQKGSENPINGIFIDVSNGDILDEDKRKLATILQKRPHLNLYVYDKNKTEHIVRFAENEEAKNLLRSFKKLDKVELQELKPFVGFQSQKENAPSEQAPVTTMADEARGFVLNRKVLDGLDKLDFAEKKEILAYVWGGNEKNDSIPIISKYDSLKNDFVGQVDLETKIRRSQIFNDIVRDQLINSIAAEDQFFAEQYNKKHRELELDRFFSSDEEYQTAKQTMLALVNSGIEVLRKIDKYGFEDVSCEPKIGSSQSDGETPIYYEESKNYVFNFKASEEQLLRNIVNLNPKLTISEKPYTISVPEGEIENFVQLYNAENLASKKSEVLRFNAQSARALNQSSSSQTSSLISQQNKDVAGETTAAETNGAKLKIIDPTNFPQQNAAEEFNKLSETDKRKILEGTRITVTEEEVDLAKRFIALVAISEGETGGKNDGNKISQKEVYEDQGILPKNCLEDCQEGSLEEKINLVAAKITSENIRAFYKRLIEKRPKVFFCPEDVINDKADPHYKIEDDLNLPEYVGYSEIEFGAMLQVFGATQFINDGGRGNQGKKRVDDHQVANAGNSRMEYEGYVSGAHEEFGYISAIVGMRLETEDPAMERLHVIEGEREKAIQQYDSSKGTNEKGDFARMKNVKIDFVKGHKLIWDKFYKQNSQQKEGSSTAAGVAFKDEVAKQRLCISYKKFLAESIANAQQDGKKAHIRITGCGDGVWANHQEAKVKSAIGKAVRMAFDELGEEQKSQISAIEFCEFGGESYYQGFTDGNTAKEINGVKIVKSGAKFSDELEENEKKSDEKDTVLCVNFAWDGGSYVGNEYWNDLLFASGDPAAACCSSIAISMNPEINPQFLDKLFVVSKNGIVSEVDGESSTIKVTPESTEQETQKITSHSSLSLEESEESCLDEKTPEETEVDSLKSPDKDDQKSTQEKEFKKTKVSFESNPIKIKREIEAKIFVNPEGGSENLSAEDVAIRKVVGNGKELVKKMRKKWSEKKSGEKESVLEYAAKGVFSKALKAKENLKSSSRNTVKGEEWGQKDSEEWKKKSQEVWYDRFVRTDFEGVDLSETFRTVFVNCTFDKNCVLPTEKSSIDPKYFSNCKFSKELMNKVENKKLKEALSKAGMKDDPEDSGFYKMDNEKDKKENPNPSFKPIESFQLIKNSKLFERDGF